MDIPYWFGQFEYLVGIITVWFGLISWIIVNYLRTKGVKLIIKSKVISIKDWWAKRKKGKVY